MGKVREGNAFPLPVHIAVPAIFSFAVWASKHTKLQSWSVVLGTYLHHPTGAPVRSTFVQSTWNPQLNSWGPLLCQWIIFLPPDIGRRWFSAAEAPPLPYSNKAASDDSDNFTRGCRCWVRCSKKWFQSYCQWLLAGALSRLLAGVLHWIRGAGLSRLVSIPVVHPPHHYLCVYCCDATMFTRHPRHTARPTAEVAPGRQAWQCAEELCSPRLCAQGLLVPWDK